MMETHIMMKLRTCNKFIPTSDCGFIVLDEEFEDGFVYVYVFQVKANNTTYNQTFIRTNKYQDIKCTIKKDGHYTILVCKVQSFLYNNEKFMNGDLELTLLDIIDSFKFAQYDYFSVCLLRQCFINLCKTIFDFRGSIDCNRGQLDKDIVYKRDLVWAALHIIQYLTDMCQYKEALRVLDRIIGCNGLCEEHKQKGEGCGCG